MKGENFMDSSIINVKDELIMSLVHYFVTEENYTPINVRGAKNEIWLENLDAPYKIIRINSKYIHNNEQLDMDMYKLGFVVRQIKRKTLSLKMNVLNICLDMNDSIDLQNNNNKNIETINISSLSSLKKNKILAETFPNIKTDHLKRTNDIMKIISATEDINKKTEKENDKYEEVFKPKKIIVTKIIILLCVICYLITIFKPEYLYLFCNSKQGFLNLEIYRLLTNTFLHGGIFHLLVNMYSLWIIGNQVETYIGKTKFTIIYLLSALMGSLFSVVFLKDSLSLGASGAIFGLMGSLLYFGYHYRLYLSNALTSQIIPIIVINLILGFTISGIDNAAHIGGLIGGYLATMLVGVKYKSSKSEQINGSIVYTLLVIFLCYVIFKLV